MIEVTLDAGNNNVLYDWKPNNLSETTPAAGDLIPFIDVSDSNALKKLILSNILAIQHFHAASDINSGTLDHEYGGLEDDVSDYDGVVTISGGVTSFLKHNWTASTVPGTGDDSDDGYAVGSTWWDQTGKKIYSCTDASVGAAVWVDMTTGGEIPP